MKKTLLLLPLLLIGCSRSDDSQRFSPDYLPDDTRLIQTSGDTAAAAGSRFLQALKESGYDPKTAAETAYPKEVNDFLAAVGFDSEKTVRGITLFLTAGSDDALTGGGYAIDADLDTAAFMEKLVKQPHVAGWLGVKPDRPFALEAVDAGIGKALRFSVRKNDVFLKDDLVFFAGSPAPKVLVVADEVNFNFICDRYAGRKTIRKALARDSFLGDAFVLKPLEGKFRGERIGAIFSAEHKRLAEKLTVLAPAQQAEMLKSMLSSFVGPLEGIKNVTGGSGETPEGNQFIDTRLEVATEEEAEALLEFLIGVRAMARGVMSTMNGLPQEVVDFLLGGKFWVEGVSVCSRWVITPADMIMLQTLKPPPVVR